MKMPGGAGEIECVSLASSQPALGACGAQGMPASPKHRLGLAFGIALPAPLLHPWPLSPPLPPRRYVRVKAAGAGAGGEAETGWDAAHPK